MKHVALVCLSLIFAWTAFQAAGVEAEDWNISVLALAVLALVLLSRSESPSLEAWIAWPLALLPAWVLVQMIPLPPALVRFVSPARAELASALPHSGWIPLSACPAATLAEWMRLAGAILVFLIVRELAWRYSEHRTPWVVIWPLISVAAIESALGLAQFYTAGAANAHGTYRSYDHFAGLLEMALPFAVMHGISAWRGGQSRFSSQLKPALRTGASFSIAALLLIGAVDSLSRMGFLAALFALGVLGAAALPRKRGLLALPAAALLLVIYLPPDQLIERFAQISTTDKIASQDRVAVWRETLPLIAAYPATGCGLGAFESVFVRFKRHAPGIVDNYAHNDYLQYLAEVGIFGFALGLALVGGLLITAARASSRHASAAGRALTRASLASMAALLLHSTVDFNTYIPANAFAFAWIAAVAASAMFSSRPVPAFETESVLELRVQKVASAVRRVRVRAKMDREAAS